MISSPLVRACRELVALPLRSLLLLVQQISQWAVAKGRRARQERRPRWQQIRPQSRVLEDPPGERATVLPFQARWLARVLASSRPLGP